jgi:hypothetical protein
MLHHPRHGAGKELWVLVMTYRAEEEFSGKHAVPYQLVRRRVWAVS